MRQLSSAIDSGTVWLEVVMALGSTPSGGFPNLRLSNLSDGNWTGGIGSNQGLYSNYYLLNSYLDGGPETTVGLSSSTFVTALLEIDYTANTSYLWINPNAFTFTGDTSTADGTATSFSPAFDRVSLFAAGGDQFDSIRIGTTYQDALGLPEPGTLALLGSGLLAALWRKRARE
jgi:hypothetical protein